MSADTASQHGPSYSESTGHAVGYTWVLSLLNAA